MIWMVLLNILGCVCGALAAAFLGYALPLTFFVLKEQIWPAPPSSQAAFSGLAISLGCMASAALCGLITLVVLLARYYLRSKGHLS